MPDDEFTEVDELEVELTEEDIEQAARRAHDFLRAYRLIVEGQPCGAWNMASDKQKSSAISLVRALVDDKYEIEELYQAYTGDAPDGLSQQVQAEITVMKIAAGRFLGLS